MLEVSRFKKFYYFCFSYCDEKGGLRITSMYLKLLTILLILTFFGFNTSHSNDFLDHLSNTFSAIVRKKTAHVPVMYLN